MIINLSGMKLVFNIVKMNYNPLIQKKRETMPSVAVKQHGVMHVQSCARTAID